jgi:hypothetical protein
MFQNKLAALSLALLVVLVVTAGSLQQVDARSRARAGGRHYPSFEKDCAALKKVISKRCEPGAREPLDEECPSRKDAYKDLCEGQNFNSTRSVQPPKPVDPDYEDESDY